MGFLRVFLAISVVIGHTSPIFGLRLMPATSAVQLFFIISGFYMSLILSGKYEGRSRNWFFYSNRFLRLYPTYFISLIITILVYLSVADLHHTQPLVSAYADRLSGSKGAVGLPSLIAASLVNLVALGSDVLYLCRYSLEHGWTFTFGFPAPHDPHAVRGGDFLLIGPLWSIGIEIWFYLLAPYLSRVRTSVIMIIAVLSLVMRLLQDHWLPWSTYFFFPSVVCFFMFGMLIHRFSAMQLFRRLNRPRIVWAVAGGGMILLVCREFIPGYRNYPGLSYLTLVFTLPFLFEATKAVPWDRWIGNLSYPIYLLHTAAIQFLLEKYGTPVNPLHVIALTMVVSLAINVLIEHPLERYRQRRAAVSLSEAVSNNRALHD